VDLRCDCRAVPFAPSRTGKKDLQLKYPGITSDDPCMSHEGQLAPAFCDSPRIESIDIFRGLTMLLMVFVNDLGGPGQSDIVNFPAWLWHATKPDTVYFADAIAPAFLFIVGMAIPLANARRRERGDTNLRVWFHALTRTASLMLIGIGMGNMRSGRLKMMPWGIGSELWTVLLLLSFILIWNQYPKAKGKKKFIFEGLRLGGMLLLAGLFAIYREGPKLQGLQCRWFVIGAIGWAYLVSSLIYFVFRRHPACMFGCMGLLILLAIGDREGVFSRFPILDGVRHYVSFGKLLGIYPFMAIAGVMIGTFFLPETLPLDPRKRIARMGIFAAGLYLAGFFLRPLYGASKRTFSPTWALYSTAVSVVAFAFLYWLIDVRGIKRWARFLVPVGQNPLLVYFLSYMLHPLMQLAGIHGLNNWFHSGWPGVLRTVVVSVLLVLFSGWLTTRCRIVLKL
jgi:heparan-alpha-glucosaminide N-acetyltransferase